MRHKLEQVTEYLNNELERIGKKEMFINKNFGGIVSHFKELRKYRVKTTRTKQSKESKSKLRKTNSFRALILSNNN